MNTAWPRVVLGEVLRKCEDWIDIQPDISYREVTVRLWGKGVAERRTVLGAEIKADRRHAPLCGRCVANLEGPGEARVHA